MKRKAPVAVDAAVEAFAEVTDPRVERRKLHSLMNVLVMTLSGALAGATGWEELAIFAKAHLEWFKTFLDVPNGAPSADTFRRVFEVLDPRELEAALQSWIRNVSESLKGEVVAIDGKSLRGVIEKAGSTTPLHLLHVWATEQRLLLGLQRVEGAPGEIAAIPELLKRMRVEGAIITTDANGCTKDVSVAIREAKADYVLALKGNRGALHKQIVELFDEAEACDFAGAKTHRSTSKGHGRTEERVVRVMPLEESPEGWADLKSVVMIDRTRILADKTENERHYYISSLGLNPAKIAKAIRSHWGIENQLHWALDVAFDEDSLRIRDAHAAENYALISRLALMMLKRAPEKLSVNLKRKQAAWNPQYLSQLLFGGI